MVCGSDKRKGGLPSFWTRIRLRGPPAIPGCRCPQVRLRHCKPQRPGIATPLRRLCFCDPVCFARRLAGLPAQSEQHGGWHLSSGAGGGGWDAGRACECTTFLERHIRDLSFNFSGTAKRTGLVRLVPWKGLLPAIKCFSRRQEALHFGTCLFLCLGCCLSACPVPQSTGHDKTCYELNGVLTQQSLFPC